MGLIKSWDSLSSVSCRWKLEAKISTSTALALPPLVMDPENPLRHAIAHLQMLGTLSVQWCDRGWGGCYGVVEGSWGISISRGRVPYWFRMEFPPTHPNCTDRGNTNQHTSGNCPGTLHRIEHITIMCCTKRSTTHNSDHLVIYLGLISQLNVNNCCNKKTSWNIHSGSDSNAILFPTDQTCFIHISIFKLALWSVCSLPKFTMVT